MYVEQPPGLLNSTFPGQSALWWMGTSSLQNARATVLVLGESLKRLTMLILNWIAGKKTLSLLTAHLTCSVTLATVSQKCSVSISLLY